MRYDGGGTMKPNQSTFVGIIVVIGMCGGIMYGVTLGNTVVSLSAFLLGSFLLFMIKRSVDSVIEDEWTKLVEQKASAMTMNITAFVFTLVGLYLITVSSPEQNYDLAVFAIAAFLITLVGLYTAMTFYYTRTLRGNQP